MINCKNIHYRICVIYSRVFATWKNLEFSENLSQNDSFENFVFIPRVAECYIFSMKVTHKFYVEINLF